jgi:hypothetical protein
VALANAELMNVRLVVLIVPSIMSFWNLIVHKTLKQ